MGDEFLPVIEAVGNIQDLKSFRLKATFKSLGTLGGLMTLFWLVVRVVRIITMTIIKSCLIHETRGSMITTVFRAVFSDLFLLMGIRSTAVDNNQNGGR